MYEAGQLALLIEQFYEGALEPGGWTGALETVTRIMDSAQSLIMAYRGTGDAPFAINENFGVPDEITAQYNAHYSRYDPALAFVEATGVGQWYHDREQLGERAMARSAFYQEFMRPAGYSSIVANRISGKGNFESFLSLQRAVGQPAFTREELNRLLPALPHIQRAIAIRARLQAAARDATLGKRLLDSLQLPIMVAQADGRVLMVNARAEGVMTRHPRLAVRGGALQLRGSGATTLQQLLRDACGASGPAVAGSMKLWTPSHELALQIVVTPLPARLQQVHEWGRPLALVMLEDPGAPDVQPDAALRQIYGLTAAQARVAALLARGAAPADIAQQLGVSIFTVRAHLKSVFEKTGARRQLDLMRELAPILAIATSR